MAGCLCRTVTTRPAPPQQAAGCFDLHPPLAVDNDVPGRVLKEKRDSGKPVVIGGWVHKEDTTVYISLYAAVKS